MRTFIQKMVIAVTCVFGFTITLYGQTNVSGLISSNTTWNLSGSPYIITGNTLLDSGYVLTVDAGVIVKFNPAKILQVRGTLRAIGSATSKIRLTSNNSNSQPGDWEGIVFDQQSSDYDFNSGAGSVLRNCILEYANHALTLTSCTPLVDSCLFRYNKIKSIETNGSSYSSKLQISNNIFTQNGNSTNGSSVVYVNGSYGDMDIIDNIFCNNIGISYGMALALGGGGNNSNEISGNVFANNTVQGGYNYGSILQSGSYSLAMHNNAVIQNVCFDHVIDVGGNILLHNTVTQNYMNQNSSANLSSVLYFDVPGSINYCNIFNNAALINYYEIENQSITGNTDVDAKNTWFGTTNTSTIDSLIYDWFDNSNYTFVLYSPLLTTPDTVAPISPPFRVQKKDMGSGNILLSWDPNPESDLAGYKIYWGNPTGYSFSNSINVGNVNQYLLTGVNITDTFSVTAYDNSMSGYKDLVNGHESWFSLPADSSNKCSAFFTLYPDSTPHFYTAINYASGISPITYSWDWGDSTALSTQPYPSHTYSNPGFYTICLTINDGSGCADTFCTTYNLMKSTNAIINVNVIPPTQTGIKEIKEQGFNIYPNPVENELYFSLPEFDPSCSVKIYNILGELETFKPLTISNTNLNVASLNKGIYIIEINSKGKLWRSKFVKL